MATCVASASHHCAVVRSVAALLPLPQHPLYHLDKRGHRLRPRQRLPLALALAAAYTVCSTACRPSSACMQEMVTVVSRRAANKQPLLLLCWRH